MNKKALLLVSVFSLGGAVSVMADSPDYTGTYAGIKLGYATGDSWSRMIDNINKEDKSDISGKGILGGFQLGYGKIVKGSYYIGVDLSGVLSSMRADEHRSSGDNRRLQLKKDNSIALAAQFGKVINGALIYIQLGLTSSRWEAKSNDDIFTPKEHSRAKRLLGFTPGFGIKSLIGKNKNFIIEAKYTHTNYQTFHHRHEDTVTSGSTKRFLNAKYCPKSDQFMVAISYKFGSKGTNNNPQSEEA